MAREGLFIGEAARQTGLSIHTIRFYEAEKLLSGSPRTGSGYRLYSLESVEQLKFIRRAQEIGFSLGEIRELLLLRDRGADACSHVKSLLEQKLENVRAKRRELEIMEKDLRRALTDCKRRLRFPHPGNGKQCPVLVKLGRQG